jgi:D-alanyl-lipoteichoic acid acyltransferase DltB (MBOAT superfamily)
VSIQDFWRRWHISLSTWLRDYLYIPLGGNRCSKIRKYFNIMVTFIASGVWHGAGWNFVFWGGLHGAYQIAGDILKPFRERVIKIFKINTRAGSYTFFQMLWTFILVDISWIFFRAGFKHALQVGWHIIKDGFHPWIFFDKTIYNLGLSDVEFRVTLAAIAVLMAVNFFQYRNPRTNIRAIIARQNLVFKYAFYLIALFPYLYSEFTARNITRKPSSIFSFKGRFV